LVKQGASVPRGGKDRKPKPGEVDVDLSSRQGIIASLILPLPIAVITPQNSEDAVNPAQHVPQAWLDPADPNNQCQQAAELPRQNWQQYRGCLRELVVHIADTRWPSRCTTEVRPCAPCAANPAPWV
jgi:hypothetical protein